MKILHADPYRGFQYVKWCKVVFYSRAQFNLTQQELADRAMVSAGTINAIEHYRRVSLATIVTVSFHLGILLNAFVETR